MPLTKLDPNTALIVIDLQKGIAGGTFLHSVSDILSQTCSLVDAFRANNLPVALVNVAGRAPGRTEQGPRSSMALAEGWSDLLPELDPQPGARSQPQT